MAGTGPSSSDLDNFLFSMKRASLLPENDTPGPFKTDDQKWDSTRRPMENQPQTSQMCFSGPYQHQQQAPHFQNRNSLPFVRPHFTLTKNEPLHHFDQLPNATRAIRPTTQQMDYQWGQNSYNDLESVVNNRQNHQVQFGNHIQQAPINRPQAPFNRPQTPFNRPQAPFNRPQAPFNRPQTPFNRSQAPINRPQALINRPQAPINRPQAPINRPQTLLKNQQCPPDNQQLNYMPQNTYTVRHQNIRAIRPQTNYAWQESNSVRPLIADPTIQIRRDSFHNQPMGHMSNDNMGNRQSFGPPSNTRRDLPRNQPFSGFKQATAEPARQTNSAFQQLQSETVPRMKIAIQPYESTKSPRSVSGPGDFSNFKPASTTPTRPDAFHSDYLNSDKPPSEKSADQIWVDSWIQGLKKTEKSQPKRTVLTISNYKCCLQEAIRLRRELERLVSCVDNITDQEELETHTEDIKKTRSRLENLNQILSDEATLENIKKLVLKRKLKRGRLKRQRIEEYKDRQDELMKRENLHQEIDKIQNKLWEKSQQEKQNKEMKATADKTLSEVRRKLTETNRMMEIITGLQKLRQLRCQSTYPSGMYLGMESDTDFSEQTNSLLTLLTDQKKVYETEEKTLKVMLETEQEETKEREKEKARLFKAEKKRREERMMNERVFGKEDKLTYDDPLMQYKQFYRQAETSLESLVAIRQTWDMYLVGDQTPGSRAIPQNWVLASEPSDDNWANFLK